MTWLPQLLWAQRRDRLYLTIDLQDAKDPQIKLENDAEDKHGKLSFSGLARSHATGSEAHEYGIDLEFFGPIDSKESKISVTDRSIVLVIAKKGETSEHWPRLLAKSGKSATNIKVDWNKWVDDDEEDEKPDSFDMAGMQDFSNFGDMGQGPQEDDSDDEELPDLEASA